jgi:hypothetical protein
MFMFILLSGCLPLPLPRSPPLKALRCLKSALLAPCYTDLMFLAAALAVAVHFAPSSALWNTSSTITSSAERFNSAEVHRPPGMFSLVRHPLVDTRGFQRYHFRSRYLVTSSSATTNAGVLSFPFILLRWMPCAKANPTPKPEATPTPKPAPPPPNQFDCVSLPPQCMPQWRKKKGGQFNSSALCAKVCGCAQANTQADSTSNTQADSTSTTKSVRLCFLATPIYAPVPEGKGWTI